MNDSWDAAPETALWCGEILYSLAVTDDEGRLLTVKMGLVCGYSNNSFPDPRVMCPEQGEVEEERLTRQWGRGNMKYQPEDGPKVRKFLVWRENGDLLAEPHTYREAADVVRAEVRTLTRRDGKDALSGVLSTYGYSIQVIEENEDITKSFVINHPDCSLDDGVIAGEES